MYAVWAKRIVLVLNLAVHTITTMLHNVNNMFEE